MLRHSKTVQFLLASGISSLSTIIKIGLILDLGHIVGEILFGLLQSLGVDN